jgi:hypothetical protein
MLSQIFYKIHQKLPAKLMMVGDGPEKKSRILMSRIRYFGQSNLLETVMKLIKF